MLQRRRRNYILGRMACRTKDSIDVPLQSLDDLFALQIPDVHRVVFAARHNPLAARHWEIGEDAVFLVFVARVRLQALSLWVVPQFQCVVERRRQNVFAIGRELNEWHRWIVVVDQCFQTLAAGRVPDTTEAVVAGGDNQGAVAIKVYRADGIRVGWQRL